MLYKIICSGFGGQGVLTAGKILLHAAYKKGLYTTWFPSYGNEMRGGAANCNVIISDERIASPYADHPDVLICLNDLAVDRFESTMQPGGKLFVNTSLVDEKRTYRPDVTVIGAAVTDKARELGSERNANLCMLGKVINETDLFTVDEFNAYLCDYFAEKGKAKYNAKNTEIFLAGTQL